MTPDIDSELIARLRALEERAPGGAPPALQRRRRLGRALPFPVALGLAAVIAGSALAGAAILQARGTPGVENPGQPLAGANLECMAPPQAAAFLAAHGYARVVWQVESGPAGGKGDTSVQVATPPAHGYVIPGSVISGTLYVVVDQRAGASGVGTCHGMPMP